MELVKFIKGLAIGFALTVGLAQSASAGLPWVDGVNPLTVPVAQAQLEMESCGLLGGDVLDIYSRCIAINLPRYHGGQTARWYSRNNLCWEVHVLYSKARWPKWRPDVVAQTIAELDLSNGACIRATLDDTLESIVSDALPDACGDGTVPNAEGTQCIPAYNCLLGGLCAESARLAVTSNGNGWFSAEDGNVYAGDTHQTTGCAVREQFPYDDFQLGTALARNGVVKELAQYICR